MTENERWMEQMEEQAAAMELDAVVEADELEAKDAERLAAEAEAMGHDELAALIEEQAEEMEGERSEDEPSIYDPDEGDHRRRRLDLERVPLGVAFSKCSDMGVDWSE